MLSQEQYLSRYPKKTVRGYNAYVKRKENEENPAPPVDDVGNFVPTILVPTSEASMDITPNHLVSSEVSIEPTIDPVDRNHQLAVRQLGNNGKAAPVITHRPVLVYKGGRPSMHAKNISQHLIEVE